MNKARKLRSILTGYILALAFVALVSGVSLVLVTNALDRASRGLSQSVESVRLTEEAEIGLLVHARLDDPLARSQSESSVMRNLEEARDFVGTEQEGRILRESLEAAEAYFLATSERRPDAEKVATSLERAFRSIEQLAQINVAQSHDARDEARSLNRTADVISMTAMALLVLIVPLSLWWLNAKAFRPSFSLARVMRRFAGGDWEARALESGPKELRDMASYFNDMADRITQQRRSQSAFLAGVAHDIRTPLNALKLSAEAIPPDKPLPPEERIRRTVAVVDRQVGRLERMVHDFLDTARIEAGELALSIDRLDAREFARAVAHLFAESSPLHSFELELPDAPVWIAGDEGRIEQVLNNLVSNAIKYSPEGGEVRISVETREGWARLAVADQGIGIRPEEQERLFEPFRRAGRPGAGDQIPGVGLGLFLSRRLVEAHGGTIEVESAPGRGATFVVWLPRSRSPPA